MEKLRWAEKEWRELDRELAAVGGEEIESHASGDDLRAAAPDEDEEEEAHSDTFAHSAAARRS